MLLKFGYGEDSIAKENIFFVFGKNKQMIFDYLVFFDSRGGRINNMKIESTLMYKLKNILENNFLSYILISRPKNLTIFATLYNFLKLNPDLKFKNLITNLGFVDCTPKKQYNIDDMLLQIKQFSNTNNFIIEHESYKLNNGNVEILKSIDYSTSYIKELNTFLSEKFEKCYFINTPVVPEDITIEERKRPKSFFTQLYKTNELLDNIVNLNQKKSILVDIKDFNYTYDAVHYTEEGHEMIFNKIKESIKL